MLSLSKQWESSCHPRQHGLDLPAEVAGWSIKSFDVEAGPLAIPSFGKEAYRANLHWSPAGQAYAIRDHDLSPLCPDATRDIQVRERPFRWQLTATRLPHSNGLTETAFWFPASNQTNWPWAGWMIFSCRW